MQNWQMQWCTHSLSFTHCSCDTLDTDMIQVVFGRLWLNRPEARNALNSQLLEDIVTACDFLQRQHHIAAVVVAGKGLSFCAGADLRADPSAARRAS